MYEKLNKYVREDLPIVNVCLLSGQPGVGKSTILANWYGSLVECKDVFALQGSIAYIRILLS